MKAVIVCGSRKAPGYLVYDALDTLIDDSLELVIHGDAEGADKHAGYYMRRVARGVEVVRMPAQWDHEGKSAGPKRNQRMLDVLLRLRDSGYVVEVWAFPGAGSIGTWDMVKRSEAAGVPTMVYAIEVPQ